MPSTLLSHRLAELLLQHRSRRNHSCNEPSPANHSSQRRIEIGDARKCHFEFALARIVRIGEHRFEMFCTRGNADPECATCVSRLIVACSDQALKPPAIDDRDAISQTLKLVEIVRCDDDGTPGATQSFDDSAKSLSPDRIESVRGLVENHYLL